jgi:hypothetical protein
VDETRYYDTSLRTSSKALLQHVPDRWSIENSWHWPRDTQLKEDAHRYREVQRLDGFWSITEGLATLAIEDADGTVRVGGAEILGRLVREWPGEAEAHQARLLLQQLQQDPDHRVVAAALNGLQA